MHARIQVDLLVTCGNIPAHQLLCLGHGAAGIFSRPNRWSQVITTEQDILSREAIFCRDTVHIGSEIPWGLPGIATVLIHLIAGGLNQYPTFSPQGCSQHPGMSGADGWDSCGSTLFLTGYQIIEEHE